MTDSTPPSWDEVTRREPYLQGNFAPISADRTATDLAVEGELPDDLVGVYVRNGANPAFPPLGRYHWFDGDGMVHAVFLGPGAPRYVRRYVQTKGLVQEKEARRSLYKGYLHNPAENPGGQFKNAANTSLLHHHGALFALFEAGLPYRLTLPQLATVGEDDFGGALSYAMGAHPKVDPVTGELVAIAYRPDKKPYVSCFVFDKEGKLVRRGDVDVPRCSAMHDIAITDDYLLLLDMPFTLSAERAAKGEPLAAWEPEGYAKLGVLPRKTDDWTQKARWFDVESGYVFHTVNAYQEGQKVIVDAARMERMSVAEMGRQKGKSSEKANTGARLHRYELDLETGKSSERELDEVSIEFPKVRDDRVGKKARYAYAGRHEKGVSVLSLEGIVKYDLERGTNETLLFGKGLRGSEMSFIPRRGGKTEDDGYLVGYVHDEGKGLSELWVLDAMDIKRGPRARVMLPTRVPYGFHGVWVPDLG